MANRRFDQFRLSLEKRVVDLFLNVTFGASGAPTISTLNSKGFASIARSAQGKFLITLQDNYVKLLGANVVYNAGSSGAAAPELSVQNDGVTSGTITVLTQAGGVDTDPASGEVMHLKLTLSNSTAL